MTLPPHDRAAAPLGAALDAAKHAHAAHARALHAKILGKRHLVARLRCTLLNERLGHLQHGATSNGSISAPSSESPDGTGLPSPFHVAILHPSAPDATRAAARTLRQRSLAGLTSAAFFPLTTPLTSTALPLRLAITGIALVQTTPTDVVVTVTVANDHASASVADLLLVATTHGTAAGSLARGTYARPITATLLPTLAAGATATLTAHVPAPPMWSRPVSAPLIALRLEYAAGDGGDGMPPRRVMQALGRHPLCAPDPNADYAVAHPRTKLTPHQLLHSVTMDVMLANLPRAVPLTTVVCELLARIDLDALHMQVVHTACDAWRVFSRDSGHREPSLLVADVRPSPVAHARLVVGSMSAHTLADTVAHWARDGSLRVADGFVYSGGRNLRAEKRLGDMMLAVLDSALLPNLYRDVAGVLQHRQQSEQAE